ncbi:MAG TPA: hypothetical protein VM733_22435 [Thermoanaerobaculia bacterium]|nr:hypothetical protein [Thermoanaerobaculia bacterium]
MSAALRYLAVLTLIVTAARGFAQETTTAPTATTDTAVTATTTTEKTETTETTATATEEEDAEKKPRYATHGQFEQFLNEHYSEEVSTVIALEPALLTNQEFLQGHPDLADYIKAHPEVAQHPTSYAAQLPRGQQRQRSTMEHIVESLSIFGTFAVIAFALAWLVRTYIEQKRWSRLSKTQSEVHNKILDRFGSTEELIQYIKTPAGSKFLESAPIPLYDDRRPVNPPQMRTLWSIQAGVVIAAGALGLLMASFRFDRDTAQDLFALGTIGFCIGAGFILSAIVSLILSRRLGALQQQEPAADDLVK